MKLKTIIATLTATLLIGINAHTQNNYSKRSHQKASDIIDNNRWLAWSSKPAIIWENAFVTGNGSTGAMHFGKPGKERLTCVQEELFIRSWDRNKIAVANIAALLPRVRQMIAHDSLEQAAQLAADSARKQLIEMGAPQSYSVSPHPAFDLNINTTTLGDIRKYRRQLNLETGESLIRWEDDRGLVEQSVFSSRVDHVNVVRIRGVGRTVNVTLDLEETPGRKGFTSGKNIDVSKAFKSIKSNATSDGWLSYHAQYAHDAGGYEGLARVTTDGGRMTRSGNFIQIEGAKEILIVMRITPLQYGAITKETVVKNELSILPVSYGLLLKPHAKVHAEMFGRVTLDMGCEAQWANTPTENMLADINEKGASSLFLEQMHAMGRYLFISSSGKYPPPLQGIWGGSWTPAWVGGFVFDSNVNLAISNMSVGDLEECAQSYFSYVERMLPGWRLNAKSYLGTRGFLVPNYSDPEKGFLNHFKNTFPWMYWAAGAGWNLMPFYEHGMLYADTVFLRKRVYPLYIEMAQFYEDFLVKGDDGYYHFLPSISPENSVPSTKTILAKDATMDIAVAKEVFSHLLKMGKMFNASKNELSLWRSYHDQILPYRINSDGALAEWAPENYADNYKHRHNSHLYPIFPGTEFLQPETDPALYKAAGVALDKRFETDTESAHGLIHVSLMAARMRQATRVMDNLNRFARRKYVYTGLITSHNPNHQIYNLDAGLSLSRLLSDMLVFSQPGRIELLPACSQQFPAGSLSGIRIHGGQKIDISWKDGKLKKLTIHALKKGKLTLIYNSKEKEVRLSPGTKKVFDMDLNEL